MKSLIDEILSVFAIKASEKGIRLEPLSIETKIELLQKYLPTVHRFQENINFDNLISQRYLGRIEKRKTFGGRRNIVSFAYPTKK